MSFFVFSVFMTVALSVTQFSILCPYIRPELTKILSAPNFASAIRSASKGKSKGDDWGAPASARWGKTSFEKSIDPA
jgi:hypothetical protein